MYNPLRSNAILSAFIQCTAKEDRIGNLMIWQGVGQKPTDDSEIAYIQRSQEKSDIYANCFELTWEEVDEIQNGWATVIHLHEDYVSDIFS